MTPPRTDLPVEAVIAPVRAALADRGVAVLVASPGAGKTTVVPLRLLDEPWLGTQRIVVLEPRRLAARAAARRMADLLGEPVGRSVGYRTRDERVGGRDLRIEVVTEGILVRRLQHDPTLAGTGLVVLDEVHERNLVTDLSLAFALDARSGLRPDLRVLAMSATADAGRLAALLGGDDGVPSPVVTSEGRRHPVAVHHLVPGPRERLDALAVRGVGTALAAGTDGDVLVFLPGAADIRRVGDRLRAPGTLPANVVVHALFGALGTAEQDAALEPSPPGTRRVVLATDIAESSLTVAGVRVVVDAGLVRVPAFDASSGLTRLRTEPASVASVDQRAGRAGRLGPGTVYRLWDKADASRRPAFAHPEIAVADLAGLALELAMWGVAPDQLRLPDPPPAGSYADALALLRELGALDDGGRPTERGREMAELPVHPRLAAMVLQGRQAGRGWTAAVVAAVLEERDVLRGQPGAVPVDVALRVEVVADRQVHHGSVDQGARRSVRRRAEQLAQRAGVKPAAVDLDAVGELVAVAHPERIAQAQGQGRFRFRGGGGGRIEAGDPLHGAAFLAVAEVDAAAGTGLIRLAAGLDESAVRVVVGADLIATSVVGWDDARNDLVATTEVRSGALVLERSTGRPAPGPDATDALVAHVVATAGAALPWTPAVRLLQARAAFARTRDPERWPDVSDAALLADLDGWLAPHLPGATGRRDLERLDLRAVLLTRLPHGAARELDALAPTSFTAADGRTIAIAYEHGVPRASARAQDLFGMTVHPTVAGGQVPVVLELLSPARRPIQVTADLPGFWRGSWAEVRKEMAGRYPKHPWPADPAAATPPAPRSRRR